MQVFAYCWRDGVIKFGTSVPKGALEIGQGDASFVAEVRVSARHSYAKGVLLVPGIPEAANDFDAEAALGFFIKRVRGEKITKRDIRNIRAAQERALRAAASKCQTEKRTA